MQNPRRTVLVAHEDPIQQRLVDMLLAQEAYDLVTLDNGRDVLSYLKDNTPDIALLSYRLPLVAGTDISAKMKSIRRLARVPVVLLLPSREELATEKAREVARLVGADLMLQMPLGDKNLRERIQALLNPGQPIAQVDATKDTMILERALASIHATPPPEYEEGFGAQPARERTAAHSHVATLEARIAELERELQEARANAGARDARAEKLQELREENARKADRIAALEARVEELESDADRGGFGLFRKRRA